MAWSYRRHRDGVMSRSTQGGVTLAQGVKLAREEAGFSQVELARRAGLNETTITHIETGKSLASATTLTKLADAMGLGVVDLFTDPASRRRAQEVEVKALKLERQNWKLLHAWRTFLDSVAMRWERKGEEPTPPEVRVVVGALERMMAADVFEPGPDEIARSEVELIFKAVERLQAVAERVLAEEDARHARRTFEAIEAQAV